jgi:hypothetical protein
MNCIITFDSIHRVMKAEKILNDEAVSLSLVPTPRHISSDCGMVVRIDCDDLGKAQKIIREHGLTIEGVYEIRKDGIRRPERG